MSFAVQSVDGEQREAVWKADYDKLKAAVLWVLEDAAYKAPESMDYPVTERWLWRLREAVRSNEDASGSDLKINAS